ncbi:hypothetical protein ACE38V_10850 [Cytobacillus sp. Hz8]|uniref:hypothetical protein n=1 Tax=Cytobacillus sp. Hz8 TaxID=3347168 RepID=UPI0035D87EC7
MSLTTAKFSEIVKRQFLFKLKANIDSYSSLTGIQVLAILFSFGGVASGGFGTDWIDINVHYFSADIVIAFTMLWSFTTAITITKKAYWSMDFSFVSNRLSSNVSNVLFLLTASLLGGITSMLASYLIRTVLALFFDYKFYSLSTSYGNLLLGIGIATLYIFCTGAIGYLIGSLIQWNRIFVFFLVVLFIGLLFTSSFMEESFFTFVFQFYFRESSIGAFLLKIIFTTVLFFIPSFSLQNRMEVKR